MQDLYTLESLSDRLGGIPLSTLKHRITQLGIQASARGSRNKLLFDERAAHLIEASDQLLKEGNGINTTRRLLGLEEAAPQDEPAPALPTETVRPAAEVEHKVEAPAPAPAQASVSAPVVLPRHGVERASLERLSQALEKALNQIEAKDRQINQLQDDLRRSTEASATFQQKTFYLQGELQRLQGELREAYKASKERPWERLFKQVGDKFPEIKRSEKE